MRRPPLVLVLVGLVVIALGETAGAVISQLRPQIAAYAQARVAANLERHGLAGSAEYDAEVTARAVGWNEPTQGLAPALIRHIRDVIRELVRLGITVLLVEQNARVALSVCDRGYIMEKGVSVFEGPSAELRSSPVTREKLGV